MGCGAGVRFVVRAVRPKKIAIFLVRVRRALLGGAGAVRGFILAAPDI